MGRAGRGPAHRSHFAAVLGRRCEGVRTGAGPASLRADLSVARRLGGDSVPHALEALDDISLPQCGTPLELRILGTIPIIPLLRMMREYLRRHLRSSPARRPFYRIGCTAEGPYSGAVRCHVIARTAYDSVQARRREEGVLGLQEAGRTARGAAMHAYVAARFLWPPCMTRIARAQGRRPSSRASAPGRERGGMLARPERETPAIGGRRCGTPTVDGQAEGHVATRPPCRG